ncbi:hypothetical protein ACFVFF_22995 [Streptomyces sp. NPDC057680]|uniref:hypothetical protein n=1 Tax=Streptomyces sp. NPDC057680 TaxID=3346208 RepID=UPI00367DA3E3
MCVHVFCVDDLPLGVTVWVDSRESHIKVYADRALTHLGRLTEAGISLVNQALAERPGSPSLTTAVPCV